MTQSDQEEPFFITEEIEAEMIAAGYVFEPPPIVRRSGAGRQQAACHSPRAAEKMAA